ncbi:MAG: hypothetical protein HY749_03380 [Gammaproteobacteria bacterium]|nr:hypothetical protein [Gammaproteobacteria bacterium]
MNIAIPPATKSPLRALATLVCSLAIVPGAAAVDLITASARMQDAYQFQPDLADDDQQTPRVGSLVSSSASALHGTTPASANAGGYAYGVVGQQNGSVVLGTEAIAKASGNLVGSAKATAAVEYRVTVMIEPGFDLTHQFQQWAGTCDSGPNFDSCGLTADFLHETKGRLLYSTERSADSVARFSESLEVIGNRPLQVGPQATTTAQGSVSLTFNPARALAPAITLGGDWSTRNLTVLPAAPASQLGLFPAGSVLNAEDDLNGPLSGFRFSHLALLLDQDFDVTVVPDPHSDPSPGNQLFLYALGTFTLRLNQTAEASFALDSYTDATLAADFSHTSSFALSRVIDPTGQFDLSAAKFTVGFTPVDAVPLPGAVWLLGSSLVGLITARRRSNGRRGAVVPAAG